MQNFIASKCTISISDFVFVSLELIIFLKPLDTIFVALDAS